MGLDFQSLLAGIIIGTVTMGATVCYVSNCLARVSSKSKP